MDVRLSGNSEQINRIRSLLSQVAKVNTSVIITGASGTGKEIVARMIHQQSARSNEPFVPVNCAAIPHDLLESELFGHEKGAFSGAYNTRVGRFEIVKSGTLFLDEIGDMPLHMQAKLLRVIQEKTFERIGSNKPIPFQAKIIAATHHDLEALISHGTFREDLFYRLNVFPINMPSLRERTEDLHAIIQDLIAQHSSRLNSSIQFDPELINHLATLPWPGNIRELSNLIERMMVMYPGETITVRDLPDKYKNNTDAVKERLAKMSDKIISKTHLTDQATREIDLREVLKDIEVDYIHQALERADWVVSHAAASLKLRRTTLIEKIKKYNIKK